MRTIALFTVAIALEVALYGPILGRGSTTDPELVFLDVGQGDAQLLMLPGDVQFLVDAGPSAAVVRELEEVLGEDRYIDIVTLTHLEKDHFGGLPALLEKYELGVVLWNGRRPDEDREWAEVERELRRKNVPLVRVRAGDVIRSNALRLEILAPDLSILSSGDLNEGSIVQRLTLGGSRVLLMGDAGFITEERLPADLAADVLKVGHHGSKYSSSASFLESVNPRIAVIQVGARNTYGHPASEVLGRIREAASSTLLRTDQHGRVRLIFEPEGIRVFTEHGLTGYN